MLTVLVVFNTLDYDAYACSCVIPPINANIEQTPIIFAGTLLEKIETVDRKYHYIFEIEKLWKNNSSNMLSELKNITVVTSNNEVRTAAQVCGNFFAFIRGINQIF